MEGLAWNCGYLRAVNIYRFNWYNTMACAKDMAIPYNVKV